MSSYIFKVSVHASSLYMCLCLCLSLPDDTCKVWHCPPTTSMCSLKIFQDRFLFMLRRTLAVTGSCSAQIWSVLSPKLLLQCLVTFVHNVLSTLVLVYPNMSTSDGTLLWIYRRLIGRSYIAFARQDQYIGNVSDPLGRLRS